MACSTVFAQMGNRKLVQFSGIVATNDSLKPIAFATVYVPSAHRGMMADRFGYFSFATYVLDTVEFSAVGYKTVRFIIPDTITSQHFSIIKTLKSDTIYLHEAVIYPWPTKEQFKQAFMNTKIPDDDLARAEKNLDPKKLEMQYKMMAMDGSGNFKYAMQQQANQLYYKNQNAPNNLLNPFAWAKFIEALRNGDLKIVNDEEDY